MKAKIESSLDCIHTVARNFQRPAVLCSFGKDSMVLLNLVREAGYNWPVVFFREPFMAQKYDFAHQVAKDWGLEVHDYPARFRSVLARNGGVEVIGHYPFGRGEILLPTGLYEPTEGFGAEWLCAKDDVLARATGDFKVPWDCMVVGHKSSDHDPLQGDLKLHLDYKQTPGCPTLAFVIRNWTDADVWEYTETHGVPVHTTRYNKADGWKEHADRALNPDWFPACSRCINKQEGEYVYCPKIGGVINNLGASLPEPTLPTYYGDK